MMSVAPSTPCPSSSWNVHAWHLPGRSTSNSSRETNNSESEDLYDTKPNDLYIYIITRIFMSISQLVRDSVHQHQNK